MSEYPTLPPCIPAPSITWGEEVSPYKTEEQFETRWLRVRGNAEEPGRYAHVTWILNEDQFTRFIEFFEIDLEGGYLPFFLEVPDIKEAVRFTEKLFTVTKREDSTLEIRAELEITEIVPPKQCGYDFQNYPGAADNFECYNLGPAPRLMSNYGTGWTEPWVVLRSPWYPMAYDDFESYLVGTIEEWDQGEGWPGWPEAGIILQAPWHPMAYDDFESYSTGTPDMLAGGEGWDEAWTILTW